MKKNKEKTPGKASKKGGKKIARKELESSLSDKFKAIIKDLGHEADEIAKDIEKAGKLIARKLSKKKKGGASEAKETKSAEALAETTATKPAPAKSDPVAVKAKSKSIATKAATNTLKAAAKTTSVPLTSKKKEGAQEAPAIEINNADIAAKLSTATKRIRKASGTAAKNAATPEEPIAENSTEKGDQDETLKTE